MNSRRCCFAATCINNKFIYVYGGISGNEEDTHKPILVDLTIEKYDVDMNIWTSFEVDNSPKLACFGWGLGEPSEMFIFGGTDGELMTSSLWKIDFD